MKVTDIHIKLSKDLYERLQKLVKRDRRTQTEVATIAIENYLRLRKG